MTGYEPVHWALLKLADSLLIMGAVLLAAVALGWFTDDWRWAGLAAFGPVAAGLYLALIKQPQSGNQSVVQEPAQDWLPPAGS